VLFLLYTISRETRLKRFLRRAVMVSVPVAIGYVMAGWNSQYGGFFKPVRMIRSVVDAKTDGSSQWREYENVNIIATFWDHPLIGTGYGHPFKEVIVLPDIAYLLEPYLPHNSLLAVWGFTGLVGFAGLTLLWVAGLYFAMRAYHAAKNPQQSTAAIAAIGAFPIYLAQSWGDLGLGAWSGELMMGIAIAMAGKLAVVTQQWNGGALWTRRRAR
jgi:O-antigen ligase